MDGPPTVLYILPFVLLAEKISGACPDQRTTLGNLCGGKELNPWDLTLTIHCNHNNFYKYLTY